MRGSLKCRSKLERIQKNVKQNYTWASIISSDRVVLDILTNRYRLVTAVDFEKGIVWIKMDRPRTRNTTRLT